MSYGSWIGTRVRKGEKYGTVIGDSNGYLRTLFIEMDDKSFDEIVMNNVGDDPEEVHEWEWMPDKNDETKWYRF